MDPRTATTRLFHTIVVLGMSAGSSACSSSSTPTPAPDAGGQVDAANGDSASPVDSGADAVIPADSGSDAFVGWAPCH
jgi:hypothetical protein